MGGFRTGMEHQDQGAFLAMLSFSRADIPSGTQAQYPFLPHNRCVSLELNCIGPATPWLLEKSRASELQVPPQGREWGAGHVKLFLLSKNEYVFSSFLKKKQTPFFADVTCLLPLISPFVYENNGTSYGQWLPGAQDFVFLSTLGGKLGTRKMGSSGHFATCQHDLISSSVA